MLITNLAFKNKMNDTVWENTSLYNKSELSPRLVDYTNVFIHPAICLFGMVTSLLSLVIFCDKKFLLAKANSIIYQYMLVISVCDFLFLLTQFFLVVIRCGSLCPFGYAQSSKSYELYIYLFIGYTIITFEVLLDISVSINRLFSFSTKLKNSSEIKFRLKCGLFLIASIVLNVPIAISNEVSLLGYSIDEQSNNTHYEELFKVNLKVSFDSPLTRAVLLAISIAKETLLFFILCILNIIIAVKLNRHMNKKSNLTLAKIAADNQVKAGRRANDGPVVKNNSTLMIFIIDVIFLIGNFMDVLGISLDVAGFFVYHPEIKNYFFTLGNMLFFSSHGTMFFVYFVFDANFKNKFFRVILKSKSNKYIAHSSINTVSRADTRFKQYRSRVTAE